MNILFYILISTFLVSLISFIGVLTLVLKEKILNKIILVLVTFSAGTLIGSSFFHLLPEAIEEIGSNEESLLQIFSFLIIGFSSFFFLEQVIRWHHHHVINCKDCPKTAPFSYLILISDGIHNLIDGFIIAASFIVSIPVGVITTLSIAFHEIPQEIGDFGVLIYGGFKKIKAVFFNFLSALLAVLGGIIGFLVSEKIGSSIIFLLPFAAGNFIYIASSDLLPEIKHSLGPKDSIIHLVIFFFGITLMFLSKILLNG
ncbi:MAG: ZIP family metal transporter [Candidatus Pacebacteria bacterium]|nr:ZIP family metal transporter [Candidatus Paceibacterota bacterium]